MQLKRISLLFVIASVFIPVNNIKAVTPDDILFLDTAQARAGYNWQITEALQMVVPDNSLTEAMEIHLLPNTSQIQNFNNSELISSYLVKVSSDEQLFKSKLRLKYLLPDKFPGAIWLWQNNQWSKSKNYELDQNNLYSVWEFDKPGDYIITLANDLQTKINLNNEDYLSDINISTPFISLTLPKIDVNNSELTVTPLAANIISAPDNLVSFIYQYDFKGIDPKQIGKSLIKVELEYYATSYLGRDLVYFDKRLNKWQTVPSMHNVKQQTVSAWLPFTYSIVAIVENPKVYDGLASWYKWKDCNCAAARFWPKQTQLKVINLSNNKNQIVKVNDYGPEEWTGRLIDLDSKVFKYLDKLWRGLIYVRIEPILD
ncbi:MAG: septal ring lytic transglycosylase RlpA family protein [Patescibacteria group bacterium]